MTVLLMLPAFIVLSCKKERVYENPKPGADMDYIDLTGKEIGFQEHVSIGFGYSVPMNGKIVSGSGTTLTTDPNLKGDFTATLQLGVTYFFSCHVGLGASFTGEYFNNKSDLIVYSLYALPIQAGFHFRF